MADNSRDAGKTSKKDAKRDAKIEAKRKKLAEQRANKAAAAAAAAGKQSENDNAAARPVTSDSANKKMRLIIPEEEAESIAASAEKKKAEKTASSENKIAESPQKGAPAVSKGVPAVSKGVPAAKEKKSSETAEKVKKQLSASAKKGAHGLKEYLKELKPTNIRKYPPETIIKFLVVLAVIIGIIYGLVEVQDYLSKKTDVIVSDAGYEHAIRHEKCVPLNGIDISQHQKGDIKWKQVKSSGVDFVFIRAGYRAADDGSLHADENFDENVRDALNAGLMVGAYFYSQALTPEEGKEEAEFVLDMVKKYDLTMPIVIDYEIYKDGRLDKKIQAGELYAASFYHDIVLGFTNTVEAAGYESAVYASKDMLTNYMQEDLIDDMANIWLARYDKTPNLNANFWFWQCSDEGKAGGIDGSVDKDFWYLEPGKAYPTRAKHKKSAVSVGDCHIYFNKQSYKIRNFRAEPKYSLTNDGQRMSEGRDYISSVVHNTQSGTGYVIIRGIGKYKDWIMFPFTIE